MREYPEGGCPVCGCGPYSRPVFVKKYNKSFHAEVYRSYGRIFVHVEFLRHCEVFSEEEVRLTHKDIAAATTVDVDLEEDLYGEDF